MKRRAKTVSDYVCISEEYKDDITSMWIGEGSESGIESGRSLIYRKIRNNKPKKWSKIIEQTTFHVTAPKWKLETKAEWKACNQVLKTH